MYNLKHDLLLLPYYSFSLSLSLSLSLCRFFFKSFCEELNDVILEEISDNSVTLPLHEGKIVGQVEGITD